MTGGHQVRQINPRNSGNKALAGRGAVTVSLWRGSYGLLAKVGGELIRFIVAYQISSISLDEFYCDHVGSLDPEDFHCMTLFWCFNPPGLNWHRYTTISWIKKMVMLKKLNQNFESLSKVPKILQRCRLAKAILWFISISESSSSD